jgi:hypothetical protein
MAYSPQANYTDWSITTGQRILVATFADKGVSHGQCGRTHMAINLIFLDQSLHFFFQVAPHLCSQGWVNPVPDSLLHRNSGSPGNCDH